MPQLVFVHGVATRCTEEYSGAVKNHKKLFKELLFPGTDAVTRSPMWGDTVPVIGADVFATNRDAGSFNLNVGMPPGLGAGLVGGGTNNGPSIMDVGRQDPVAAPDAICSEVADQAAKRELDANELQAFRNAAKHIAEKAGATLFTGNASQQSVAEQLTNGAPVAYQGQVRRTIPSRWIPTGRLLRARRPEWVTVISTVTADDDARIGLEDYAYFGLHPNFSPSIVKVSFRGGRAQLRI